MANEVANGDLLGMARLGTKRRLHSLARGTAKMDAEALTLMQSLLDEHARKSRARSRESNGVQRSPRQHPAAPKPVVEADLIPDAIDPNVVYSSTSPQEA